MTQDSSLDTVTSRLLASYVGDGAVNLNGPTTLPSRDAMASLTVDLLRLLFPGFYENAPIAPDALPSRTRNLVASVATRLAEQIDRALHTSNAPRLSSDESAHLFLAQLPQMRAMLSLDVTAAYEGDPAARSREEVLLSYPGIVAVAVQRLAHHLFRSGVPILPRMMTEWAHTQTGVDIHPGAVIGPSFFIDHGTGVVVGETAVIGARVKIYQGVTLGAKSFAKDADGHPIKGVKRHPRVENDVTIYAGATILGDITIGEGSIIGSNVWLLESVPPRSLVTQPAATASVKSLLRSDS